MGGGWPAVFGPCVDLLQDNGRVVATATHADLRGSFLFYLKTILKEICVFFLHYLSPEVGHGEQQGDGRESLSFIIGQHKACPGRIPYTSSP